MPPNRFRSIQSQRVEATRYVQKETKSCNTGVDDPGGTSMSLENSENTRPEAEGSVKRIISTAKILDNCK